MEMIVQREALLKPLQAINGVIEKKQTLPILANVLLTTDNNHLLLTGTDLEVELVGFVKLDSITTEGKTTVSARKLFDIARTLPDNTTIHFLLENNHLRVNAGESCFMLNTLPASDYPSLEATTYPINFSIKQSYLKNLLIKTYFAMGQQDVRHYLNGAFLDIAANTIKCVAADGHRLALAVLQDDNIGDIQTKLILPRKSVLEMIRLLSDTDDAIKINISDSRICFTTSGFIFTSKLINAQYPDYNRLIPKGATVATGEREVIKQALTRAAILASEKIRGVRFQLEPSKLRITASNADQEQAEDTVMLDYAGNEMEIGFNVGYLLDVLSSLTSKTIRCIFTDPNSGVRIEPAEDEANLNTVCYVIMPMRL